MELEKKTVFGIELCLVAMSFIFLFTTFDARSNSLNPISAQETKIVDTIPIVPTTEYDEEPQYIVTRVSESESTYLITVCRDGVLVQLSIPTKSTQVVPILDGSTPRAELWKANVPERSLLTQFMIEQPTMYKLYVPVGNFTDSAVQGSSDKN